MCKEISFAWPVCARTHEEIRPQHTKYDSTYGWTTPVSRPSVLKLTERGKSDARLFFIRT